MQCEAVSSHPSTLDIAEEASPHLVTASFLVVVEGSMVPSEPPLSRLNNPSWTQGLRCGLTRAEYGHTTLSLLAHKLL